MTVAFYLALVPVAVLFSGPVYRALACTFAECDEPGRLIEFILPTRGALRVGSEIRLPNGIAVGQVVGFRATGDERYIVVTGRLAPAGAALADQPLRCEATANFSLEMDSDLVLSTCPGLALPDVGNVDGAFVCGNIDHFERMGQELRHFVLENIRPGDQPVELRLTGPCGTDNEHAMLRLHQWLAE
jgi:hypothetical protein